MSVWTTRSLEKNNEFIVIKHKLKGINYSLKGIKFRDSYAVIEKNSKLYFELKKMPMLKDMEEFPLLHLRKLKFITRTSDVQMIYGRDVYVKYINALQKAIEVEKVEQKQEEEKQHLEDNTKCKYRSENTDELCAMIALEQSPSGYCTRHILKEPKLKELGIEVPRMIPKKEKAEWKEKVAKKLANLNKN